MRRSGLRWPSVPMIWALITIAPAVALAKAESASLRSREFEFTYAATITGLSLGQSVRIWLPVPPSTADQQVTILGQQLPGTSRIASEPKDGNRILYTEAKAGADGTIALAVRYRMMRREIHVGPATTRPAAADERDVASYLKPDTKVPVGGKPLTLLEGRHLPADQLQLARVLYDVVDNHMVYRKDKPGWGQGDAVWACESGYGNCSDFHSLFISLARSNNIPARFEIGFLLPETRGQGGIDGYHCWAQFRPRGQGWIPVDISEANKDPKMREYYFGSLTENRITFSTGRDLVLVPRQDGPPLNFFIYPYVEVNGAPYPADKIHCTFSYRDLDPAGH